MARLRLLFAGLLLAAFMLGVPVHAGAAHGAAHANGSAASAAHVRHHDGGTDKCCDDHQKLASHELCQIACSATVAVLEQPAGLSTRFSYAVQFASGPPQTVREADPAPEPIPPKPSRIA